MPKSVSIPIHAAASIATSDCRCLGPVDDVRKALNLMVGIDLYEHEILDASPWSREVLISQHPKLAEVEGLASGWVADAKAQGLGVSDTFRYLAGAIVKWYGEGHVTVIVEPFHRVSSPAESLAARMGADRVIVVSPLETS